MCSVLHRYNYIANGAPQRRAAGISVGKLLELERIVGILSVDKRIAAGYEDIAGSLRVPEFRRV